MFNGVQATNEQSHDLINARKIGHQDYTNYITHRILQSPSVANPPVRHRKLLTMAPSKKKKKKLSLWEKEEREVNKCLRIRLAWCNQTGQGYDQSIEQYSLLPRALADVNDLPHKDNKSNWTKKLQDRYTLSNTTPFLQVLDWIPEVVIIDYMFLININPLRQHKLMHQYAELLLKEFVLPFNQKGSREVHLIFDHPKSVGFNPKCYEHDQQYDQAPKAKMHNHILLDPNSPVPRP